MTTPLHTAERVSHDDVATSYILYQHLAVYEYAQQFVKDRVVMDLGCGEGYGTALLAKTAKKAVGVDYSSQAIAKARQNYKYDNIEFICSRVDRLKIESETFDVITAFQLIEHLSSPGIFLSEVQRLLKHQGLFFLSTPNKKASIIRHPYHFREYDQDELRVLLKNHFAKVSVFGLQYSPKVAAIREKRRKASEALLLLDPLRLHMLLPRFIRQKVFDLVASIMNRTLYVKNADLAEGITTGDYRVSEEAIDIAIDLVCICQK